MTLAQDRVLETSIGSVGARHAVPYARPAMQTVELKEISRRMR
jgi:hypothetical protein